MLSPLPKIYDLNLKAKAHGSKFDANWAKIRRLLKRLSGGFVHESSY